MNMYNKTLILFALIFLSSHYMQAQDPTFGWVKQIGGTQWDDSHEITLDKNGNTLLVGKFQGTCDFDPGNGVANLTSQGNYDIFIQKINSQGNFLWAKRIGGIDDDRAYSITTDIDGNIYTTGNFKGTVDFDPNVGEFNLTSQANNDLFIQKLDSNGNFIWTKHIKSKNNLSGFGITSDQNGNTITTGSFLDTVDFDPGSGVENLVARGGSRTFFLKLDKDGKYIWAKAIYGYNYNVGQPLFSDKDGNIYSTGYFSYSGDFDPGSGVKNLVSEGRSDVFIIKLDSKGELSWVNQVGGTETDHGVAIHVDLNGNVLTVGYFEGTVDFDPGSGVKNLTSNGYQDIFIQKIDKNGKFKWVKQIGSLVGELPSTIITDFEGNVYTTGALKAKLDLDPGTNSSFLMPKGKDDIFLQKLDSNGNFIMAQHIGGTSTERVSSLILDDIGNITMTGIFESSVDFDPGIGSHNLTSFGVYDIFILNLNQCLINTQVEVKETTILATTSNFHKYKWLDCDNNFEAISGETSEKFTVTKNGSYAVEITNGNCIDTSECITINTIGIKDHSFKDLISVYPNPANENITISFDGLKSNIGISILDINGKLLLNSNYKNKEKLFLPIEIPPGVYFMEIITPNKKHTKKLIIQ